VLPVASTILNGTGEVGPQIVVEVTRFEGGRGFWTAMQLDGSVTTTNDLISQQGQVFDVVHVAVAHQNVVDEDLLIDGQAAANRPRIDGNALVDQETRRPVARGFTAVTAEHAKTHVGTVTNNGTVGQAVCPRLAATCNL
jgi:hypothetical protein